MNVSNSMRNDNEVHLSTEYRLNDGATSTTACRMRGKEIVHQRVKNRYGYPGSKIGIRAWCHETWVLTIVGWSATPLPVTHPLLCALIRSHGKKDCHLSDYDWTRYSYNGMGR